MDKYYLSTEPYYFRYRADSNDFSIKRATLFDGNDSPIDDVRVSSSLMYGTKEMSHTDVINHFEARLILGEIPNDRQSAFLAEKKRQGMTFIF